MPGTATGAYLDGYVPAVDVIYQVLEGKGDDIGAASGRHAVVVVVDGDIADAHLPHEGAAGVGVCDRQADTLQHRLHRGTHPGAAGDAEPQGTEHSTLSR